MMDIEKVKEDLSICYLKAVAAINAIALEETRHDEDSIDVIIKKEISISGERFFSEVGVQLKATSSVSQYSETTTDISYKLKAKNYNDLCAKSNIPRMLALLILPEDSNDWVKWTLDELLIRGRMYWYSLYGESPTKNTATVTIKIPKTNIIDTVTIQEIIQKAGEEGKV